MKSIILALALGALVIGFGYYNTRSIEHMSAQMLEKNNAVEKSLRSGDYDGAIKAVKEMQSVIDSGESRMYAFAQHGTVNEIHRIIAELECFIEEGVRSDALSKCMVLGEYLTVLPAEYRLTPENVF